MSLDNLEKWVNVDIRDKEIRELILNLIVKDKEVGRFDLEKYMEFYDYFGECGKTYLQCLKTDKLLNKMKTSIYLVIAINKFKKALNKFSN